MDGRSTPGISQGDIAQQKSTLLSIWLLFKEIEPYNYM